CLTCGGAIGGALKREHHPALESYPLWDEGRRQAYDAERQQQAQAALAQVRERHLAERRAAYEKRRAEYASWLRNSPDWHRLRRRVLERANHVCEACLSSPASEVHHRTYAFGRLPPAWELRAVCIACHDRLHAPGDEWASAA